jgi:hypothetical protein
MRRVLPLVAVIISLLAFTAEPALASRPMLQCGGLGNPDCTETPPPQPQAPTDTQPPPPPTSSQLPPTATFTAVPPSPTDTKEPSATRPPSDTPTDAAAVGAVDEEPPIPELISEPPPDECLL